MREEVLAEAGHSAEEPEQPRVKKPYRPPTLSEWGSVEELTTGMLFAPGDDALTGSNIG
mgnify:CR=1 FL=1